MAAGDSAREVARRRRERAERLSRSADAFERGAEGERATAEALGGLPSVWTSFHDLPWPNRPLANLDHVVVGPGGVFVIDSKLWSGPITARDGVLKQAGRRRDSTVQGVRDAASALGGELNVVVTPVLCFVQDDPVQGRCGDVLVCTTGDVVKMLATRPLVFDPEQIESVSKMLSRQSVRRPKGATRANGHPSRSEKPMSRSQRRRKAKLRADLVRLVLVIGLLVVLVMRPEVVTGAASMIGDWLAGLATPKK